MAQCFLHRLNYGVMYELCNCLVPGCGLLVSSSALYGVVDVDATAVAILVVVYRPEVSSILGTELEQVLGLILMGKYFERIVIL